MPVRGPSSPPDRRKNPTRNKDRRETNLRKRDYRVVPHDQRWNVECDGKATGMFADDANSAIRLAIAQGERDFRNGMSASVSFEERDGTSRQVWP